MTSEIRANTLKNRVGLGTISFTNTGPVVSGIVTTNTLRLSDATSGSLGRLQFGNGLDLSLFHDGTNSHIINNNGYLTIQSQAGVNGIFIARNAEVNLYYGAGVRLQTSSAGITINRDLDVDGHTNLDNVSVAGVSTFTGSITATGTIETTGNELKITGTEPRLTFTDTNNNPDFQIWANAQKFQIYDSTNSATRLLINSVGNVSIGGADATPSSAAYNGSTLHLYQSGSSSVGSQIKWSTGASGHTASDGAYMAFYSDNNMYCNIRESGNWQFYTNNTERLHIDSSGNIRVFGNQTGNNVGILYNSSAGFGMYGSASSSNNRNLIFYSSSGSSSERVRITHLGEVNIGNGAGYACWTNTGNDQRPRFQLQQTGGDNRGVAFLEERGDANGMDVFISKSRGGNGVGAINSGDTLGFLKWSGADGTRQHNAAGILGWNNGTIATGRVAGNLSFYTSPDAVGSLQERLRITSDGKVCINNDTALSDLHVCTINSSEQDGTFRIGGSQASLGLVLDYDQYGNTVSRITANPTYTNGSALLKICVDGDANPDQLVLAGNGKIGVNIADNTTADLQVRTGTNGAGYFRLGGSNGNAIGMDITYTNSGATTTVFKQNYRSTHASALMEFDSGYFNFKTGTGGDSRLKISKNGQLLHGNSSEDQGWAIFWNAASGGADKGTAGQDGAGHQGVNIRSDMGPTHLDLDGTDNFTLKLINGAYSGSGIGDPNGTVAKILFNTNTYNGWNSYGAIALQSQGASAAKGQLVFMLNNGTNSMNEKLRIKSNEIDTANGEGINVYGENLNHTNDAVLFAHKTGNADWCIQASSIGNDYGMYARVGNSAAYGLAVYDSNNSTFRFRVGGNGAIYASNTTVQSISDQRLKENIVDANSQWDDIKALRFRNFNWKSDSGYADGKTYLGLIAQEVEPISPNLVEINAQTKEDIENEVTDPEYKNVKYSIVWMKAVKALQEAQARIEQLEAKVATLEGS